LWVDDGKCHAGRRQPARTKLGYRVLNILRGDLRSGVGAIGNTLDHLCEIGGRSRQKCLMLLLDILAPRQHREDARYAENNQENDDERRNEASQDRLD